MSNTGASVNFFYNLINWLSEHRFVNTISTASVISTIFKCTKMQNLASFRSTDLFCLRIGLLQKKKKKLFIIRILPEITWLWYISTNGQLAYSQSKIPGFDKNTFIIHQFILYNNSSDNQGSEINKNYIVFAFWYCLLWNLCSYYFFTIITSCCDSPSLRLCLQLT